MRSCLKLHTDKSNGQYSTKKLSGLVYELKPLINVTTATKIRWKRYKNFQLKHVRFRPKKSYLKRKLECFELEKTQLFKRNVQVSISLSHIPSQRKNKMTIFVSYKLSNHNSYHFSRTPWGTNGPGEASITLKINNTHRLKRTATSRWCVSMMSWMILVLRINVSVRDRFDV